MPHIDWTTPPTPPTPLVAALALPALSVTAPACAASLAELDAVGAAYEVAWARYGTTLTTRKAAYTSALATWTTELAVLWTDATLVVKAMERIVYEGCNGLVLKPYVLPTAST